MTFTLSKHAREEMERRGIALDMIEAVVQAPEQTVPLPGDVVCRQSRVIIDGAPYLVRVMMNERKDPAQVVTVYRTSKIAKYWRPT